MKYVESGFGYFDSTTNNTEPVITIKTNGDIFVKGKLIENDKEFVDAMREFLKQSGFLNSHPNLIKYEN